MYQMIIIVSLQGFELKQLFCLSPLASRYLFIHPSSIPFRTLTYGQVFILASHIPGGPSVSHNLDAASASRSRVQESTWHSHLSISWCLDFSLTHSGFGPACKCIFTLYTRSLYYIVCSLYICFLSYKLKYLLTLSYYFIFHFYTNYIS